MRGYLMYFNGDGSEVTVSSSIEGKNGVVLEVKERHNGKGVTVMMEMEDLEDIIRVFKK